MLWRSIFSSAAAAFYPLIILGVATVGEVFELIDNLAINPTTHTPLVEIFARYGWLIFSLPAFVILAAYLYFALTNARLAMGKRAAWFVALFLAMPLAVPLYWWRHNRTP